LELELELPAVLDLAEPPMAAAFRIW